jgi:non-heme chloroperoxidase
MPTVRTDDGVSLSYRARGTGPRDLLFMHGWGGSGAFFDPLLDRLDLTGLRAITYDLRGHGDSDKPDSGYTLDRFADDAVAVAEAAGADRVVVVGFSMSGKFGQYLTCARPDRVVGQILVAGCPAAAIPFPAETRSDWVGRAGDRARLREIGSMFITQPVAPAVLDRWADDAVRIPAVALGQTLAMCLDTSFVDRLRGAHVPTLVVGGIHDPIFTPAVLREGVVGPIAGARVALLDCSHEIPIERPAECAALIEAFLAGLGPVTAPATAAAPEAAMAQPAGSR